MVEKVYTVKEAAELLKVNPMTVARLLKAGQLSGIRVGRLWRIRERDLDALLEGTPPKAKERKRRTKKGRG